MPSRLVRAFQRSRSVDQYLSASVDQQVREDAPCGAGAGGAVCSAPSGPCCSLDVADVELADSPAFVSVVRAPSGAGADDGSAPAPVELDPL